MHLVNTFVASPKEKVTYSNLSSFTTLSLYHFVTREACRLAIQIAASSFYFLKKRANNTSAKLLPTRWRNIVKGMKRSSSLPTLQSSLGCKKMEKKIVSEDLRLCKNETGPVPGGHNTQRLGLGGHSGRCLSRPHSSLIYPSVDRLVGGHGGTP